MSLVPLKGGDEFNATTVLSSPTDCNDDMDVFSLSSVCSFVRSPCLLWD